MSRAAKLLQRLEKELYELLQGLLCLLPAAIGKYSRMIFYRGFTNIQGRRFSTGVRVKIQVPKNVSIGDNVSLNDNVWIAANRDSNGGIIIRSNVLIGPFTIIHSGNHNYENPNVPILNQGFRFGTITVEEDVWIAARCTILSGVTIGKGSVIAAGSVVNKNVPAFSIIAGVPGKIIGNRKKANI